MKSFTFPSCLGRDNRSCTWRVSLPTVIDWLVCFFRFLFDVLVCDEFVTAQVVFFYSNFHCCSFIIIFIVLQEQHKPSENKQLIQRISILIYTQQILVSFHKSHKRFSWTVFTLYLFVSLACAFSSANSLHEIYYLSPIRSSVRQMSHEPLGMVSRIFSLNWNHAESACAWWIKCFWGQTVWTSLVPIHRC